MQLIRRILQAMEKPAFSFRSGKITISLSTSWKRLALVGGESEKALEALQQAVALEGVRGGGAQGFQALITLRVLRGAFRDELRELFGDFRAQREQLRKSIRRYF